MGQLIKGEYPMLLFGYKCYLKLAGLIKSV